MSQPTLLTRNDFMQSTQPSITSSSSSSLKSAISISDALSIAQSSNSSCSPSTEEDPLARHSNTSSLKSNFKSSKPSSPPTVRFAEVRSESGMLGMEAGSPFQAPQDGSILASSEQPTKKKLSKRFSTPNPISKKERDGGKRFSTWSTATQSRASSAPNTWPSSRSTSFRSTASAPLPATTTSPAGPSQTPQNQYNPLHNYIPCLHTTCRSHYNPMTLGPTFYSPQGPYKLTRKRGLCPTHASRDLTLANEACKKAWESMRQNAGRKTLGLIAAEFEIWLQELREDRAGETKRLERRQKERVLGGCAKNSNSKGRAKDGGKKDIKEVNEEDKWDWRYTLRPCTKQGCQNEWYSVFDNRLYLFYSTPRRSGFTPHKTLCPSCARADVGVVEGRMGEKREEMNHMAWKECIEQVKKDREMETEFWEKAQERVVREKGIRVQLVEGQKENDLEGKSALIKDLCVVM